MQQIRGLIPSENNAYASSRTIKNLVSFLFSFVCYSFYSANTKDCVHLLLARKVQKEYKQMQNDYRRLMMLNDFVPLKAILSIHYHRCFTYN